MVMPGLQFSPFWTVKLVGGVLAAIAIACAAGRDAGARAADWDRCPAVIPDHETDQGIPIDLLTAISLIESGRWNEDRKELMAWPWAVMAEGRGRYLPTKRAAVLEVQRLQARGVRNIDVGCMQVNLQYHPDAFRNIDEAFDPNKNAAYAAKFLRRLYERHKSWSKAVAYYHSGDRGFNYPYRKKVMTAWRERVRNSRAHPRPVRATEAVSAKAARRAPTRTASRSGGLTDADDLQLLPSERTENLPPADRIRQRHRQLRRMHEAGMRRLDAMSERSRRQSDAFRRYMDALSFRE